MLGHLNRYSLRYVAGAAAGVGLIVLNSESPVENFNPGIDPTYRPKYANPEDSDPHSARHTSHSESTLIPGRAVMLRQLRDLEFDVLVVGGGSTGTGAALDAASRGLTVAVVEREDFSSGTSSRSTKLIWGGSRYLVQACIALLSPDLRLIFHPLRTLRRFSMDFNMVLNCHRERRFLLEKQPHLTSWIPIAVPITSWIIWPPPFDFYPAALGPLGLFPLFFKFYDALSWFSSPPSHIMSKARSQRKFPQLNLNSIKYCSIFYEGIHDDARTNLSIAETAAIDGATVLNYAEVTDFIKKDEKVVGAIVKDTITGQVITVRCKSVLMCGGPFTDELRHMEDPNAEVKRAVKGASGIHIILPSFYAPKGFGLVDMSTSDNRFLFYLPWEGHVLIGTTDKPCEPSMRPIANEDEIEWILKEATKYISPDIKLRREDVLSTWSGIRPLAIDPNASAVGSTSTASRDHLISHNPKTGVVFISGGKWTTYREMAEDAIDKVVEVAGLQDSMRRSSSTLQRHLVGFKGYSSNLHIQLIQEYNVGVDVAERLVKAYGGRARDVLEIAKNELDNIDRGGKLLPGHPYLQAEVVYAARHEWAHHVSDVLARRIRLAFLDKTAAQLAIPAVVRLMAAEFQWDESSKRRETQHCLEYLRHFGGSVSSVVMAERALTISAADVVAMFRKIDYDAIGMLNSVQVMVLGEMLGQPLSAKELDECMSYSSRGRLEIDQRDVLKWWTKRRKLI